MQVNRDIQSLNIACIQLIRTLHKHGSDDHLCESIGIDPQIVSKLGGAPNSVLNNIAVEARYPLVEFKHKDVVSFWSKLAEGTVASKSSDVRLSIFTAHVESQLSIDLTTSITAINSTLIHLIQKLSITNKQLSKLLFGINDELVEFFRDLSQEQYRLLCSAPIPLCFIRRSYDVAYWDRLAWGLNTGNQTDVFAAQAVILMEIGAGGRTQPN